MPLCLGYSTMRLSCCCVSTVWHSCVWLYLTATVPDCPLVLLFGRWRVFEVLLGQECSDLACHFDQIGLTADLYLTDW